VTRYIDRGSMAYLLATPNSRKKIILTQATISILSIALIVAYMIGLGIGVSSIMFSGELDINKFLLIKLGLFSLLTFLSGLCFAAACIFDDAKMANGVGMGACIAFLLLKMLSQASDKAEVFKYVTPISLFDPTAIIKGLASGYIGMGILFVVGIVFYLVAIQVFTKKDLSL
jgi:ABC-2 type transport system permease protein